MRLNLRLDDQARKGQIVSLDFQMADLQQLANEMVGPDLGDLYNSLADFLNTVDNATSPPDSYIRHVDVLWRHPTIDTPFPLACDRRFVASYNGLQRQQGGYSAQGYLVLHPEWKTALSPHLHKPVAVDYFPGTTHDLMMVVVN